MLNKAFYLLLHYYAILHRVSEHCREIISSVFIKGLIYLSFHPAQGHPYKKAGISLDYMALNCCPFSNQSIPDCTFLLT